MKTGFTKAPNDILRSPFLSAGAKVAWLLIAGMPDGYHPTREQWMEMLGVKEKRTWWRVVNELKSAGLIQVDVVGSRRHYTALPMGAENTPIDGCRNDTYMGVENTPSTGVENTPYIKTNKEQLKTNGETRARMREEVTGDMMVEMGCRSCGITQEQYHRLAQEIFNDWEFSDFPDSEWSKHHFLSVLRIKAKELKRNAIHQPKRKSTVTGPVSGATQSENPLAGFPTYTKTGS